MRILSLLVLASLAAGCSTTPPPPDVRSVEAQQRLDKELAELVAGPPQACLPHYRSNDMIVIDDHTLLFRDGANRVYRNNLEGVGGCAMLGGPYTLVTHSVGTGLCRGDIAQVRDIRNGILVGSCAINDFIPYTRP